MDDVVARTQALLESFEADVRAELPADAEIFDAHVHLGTDIDGMIGDFDELVGIQRRYGISGAFMFCLDEPDRHPAFSAANDRSLAFAERSEGRFVPFVRLDLAERPMDEAVRCLDAGARGIKLHPRAQKFLLNDERLAPVFELAADRRVPILIHGGRGLPPIADSLAQLVDRYDGSQLIIAHCGYRRSGGARELLLRAAGCLLRHVGVESPRRARPLPPRRARAGPLRVRLPLLASARVAPAAAADGPALGGGRESLRGILAGSANRIRNGLPPVPLSAPQGLEKISQPLTFARIHAYLSMATPLLWTRQADTIGVLGLALNACDERANGHREQTERIRELLLTARDLWRTFPELEDETDRVRTARLAFRLLHLANITAVTSAA